MAHSAGSSLPIRHQSRSRMMGQSDKDDSAKSAHTNPKQLTDMIEMQVSLLMRYHGELLTNKCCLLF